MEPALGGAFSEGAAAITTLSDGHVAVFSGMSYAPTYSAMRPYMAKLDSSNGEIIWEHEYGSILANHLFMSGKECANGNLIAAGFSFPSPDEYNGILVHTTGSGDSLWMFNYFYHDSLMLAGRGQFFDVAPAPDGGFIAVGLVRNAAGIPYPAGYSQDTWVVKVDANGCIIPGCNTVGISEQATNLLDAITIFPNPTTGPVTVRLTLPPSVANEPLELSVVGMDGRVVHQQRLMGNGEHALALYGLSAGVYYVHIAAKGKWLTGGKLVVE